MPRRTKTSTNLASSAITTRSQASARCIPPPAAVPLTPAMTGFSQSRMEVTRLCQPSRIIRDASPTTFWGASSGFGRGGSWPPRRSAPEQKAFSPAAVMTTTRTNRSDDASRTHSAIWSRMNWVMAFPASGRLRMIQQMPSSTRRIRSSPAGLSVVSLIGLLGVSSAQDCTSNCTRTSTTRASAAIAPSGPAGRRVAVHLGDLIFHSRHRSLKTGRRMSPVIRPEHRPRPRRRDEERVSHAEPPRGDRGRIDVRLRARR